MLRKICGTLTSAALQRSLKLNIKELNKTTNLISSQTTNFPVKNFCSLVSKCSTTALNHPVNKVNGISCTEQLHPKPVITEQVRNFIKFSIGKGTRKTVKAVVHRFYRLHWGIWIRTRSGRHKHLWRKSALKRRGLICHVFCNAHRSRQLDKMVSKFWRKPKYWVDSPYDPYHSREEFYITRKKPWRPEGVDYE